MIGANQGDEIGFGISTSERDDVWRVVKIHCKTKMVTVIDNDKTIIQQTFKDFIANTIK